MTEKYKLSILGENLKILRDQSKQTQEDVTHITEKSLTYIRNIESGITDPKVTFLMSLLDTYNYSGTVKDLYKRVLQ